MFSDWKSLPSLYHDVEVKLYHRENLGRSRSLRIEGNAGVKEDEIVAIVNAKGDYEVLYDIVGINGKKPIKIRFHPHILEAGKQNEIIQEALKRTTFNMFSSLLSADWTLNAPQKENTVAWKDVQELFVQQVPLIHLTNDHRTIITWKVTSQHLKLGSKKMPKGKKAKEIEKYFAKIEEKLSIHVSKVQATSGLPKSSKFFEKLIKLPLPPPSQLVDIIFTDNDFQKTLLTLELAGFPPLDDLTSKSAHQFIFSPKFGTIQLDLFSKQDVSKHCIWIPPQNVGVIGYTSFQKTSGHHLMIDCAHFRLQELPRDLSDSLADYPKAMILSSSSTSSAADAKESSKMPTPVEALFLSTNAVAVNVESASPPRRASLSSRFQVSPVSNAPPPKWRKGSDPTDIKPLHVDASLNVSKHSMVISPSDSIDSGVVSPGIISSDEDHLRKPIAAAPIATSETPRYKLRERSASECFDSIPLPGLKGILKKPKLSFTSSVPNSSTLNGLRRSPASSRMLFARSISECHDNSIESGMELDFLAESNDTLASSSPPRGIGGFFRVDEEDGECVESDSDEQAVVAAAAQIRKKRVSFSEHVQARIYRTGSSIIGQKKKNERRNRLRNRNRSSGSTDSDGTLNGTDDETPYSISPEERKHLEVLAKEYTDRNENSASPVFRSERNNASTDSAYDEEIDSDETEKQIAMLSVA